MEQNEYEVYLSLQDWRILYEKRATLSPGLRLATELHMLWGTGEPQIYADIPGMVEICREINRIPMHYHLPLASALRADGWTSDGRTNSHNKDKNPCN